MLRVYDGGCGGEALGAQVMGNVKVDRAGKQAVLTLRVMAEPAASKRGPDIDALLESLRKAGNVHPDRQPLTKSSLRVVVSNVQAKMKRKRLGDEWTDEATDMVTTLLAQPTQKRRRASNTIEDISAVHVVPPIDVQQSAQEQASSSARAVGEDVTCPTAEKVPRCRKRSSSSSSSSSRATKLSVRSTCSNVVKTHILRVHPSMVDRTLSF